MTPNTESAKHLLKRLITAESNTEIFKTLRELVQFNNPYVLPNLLELAHNYADNIVKNEAERAVHEIYLMMRYWDLIQSGALNVEYNRRVKTRKL